VGAVLSQADDRIKVLIADDHELVRTGLRTVLEAEDDIKVVGEAIDGLEAVRLVMQTTPDVLLLDLHMPKLDGVTVCRELSSRQSATRIMILTSYDGDDEVFGALAAGASAFIMKDVTPERLVQAIRGVAAGQMVLAPSVAERVVAGRMNPAPEPAADRRIARDEVLSERELEVLQLMAKGLSNAEIARELWISQTTVKTHISHILRKLGQRDRTQAIITALQQGLVELPKSGA
jgi:DNA-binding NarL/FixJ family response regulator